MGVRLNNFSLSKRPFSLNNDFSNKDWEDWVDDYVSLSDQLFEFYLDTSLACVRLVSLLEGEDPDVKEMIADAGLPEDCVPTPARETLI